MYDNFTERTRRVLVYAQREAKRFNHDYVATTEQFADWLRLSRLVASYTQIEFSELLDLPLAEYIAIEKGRRVPRETLRKKIINLVGYYMIYITDDSSDG